MRSTLGRRWVYVGILDTRMGSTHELNTIIMGGAVQQETSKRNERIETLFANLRI